MATKIIEQYVRHAADGRVRRVELIEVRTLRGSTYAYAVRVWTSVRTGEQVFRDEAYSIARERYKQEIEKL